MDQPTHSQRIVFLFGAGASYGAGHIDPKRPPLMPYLFDELKDFRPAQWGESSRLWQNRESFRVNFEKAYEQFVLRVSPDALTLLQDQWSVAKYFAQFSVHPGGQDCYSHLLRALMSRDAVREIVFASLNSDCLFEQVAERLGLRVCYDIDAGAGAAVVLKIHGSCNFVTRGAPTFRPHLSSPSTRVELGLDQLTVGESLGPALQNAEERGEFPVMSLTSPEKETLPAMRKMTEIRQLWKASVGAAECVVIIGVSHNDADSHIVDPIRDACHGLYIGGADDFAKWREVNPRFIHLGDKFEAGLPELLKLLS